MAERFTWVATTSTCEGDATLYVNPNYVATMNRCDNKNGGKTYASLASGERIAFEETPEWFITEAQKET